MSEKVPDWLLTLIERRRRELEPAEFEEWLLGVNQGRRQQGILL